MESLSGDCSKRLIINEKERFRLFFMEKESYKNNTSRKPVLDILKGLCIIMIIITHYGWSEKTRLCGLFPYTVDMAVPVFMIISGYVFSNSYIKKGIT